MTLMSQDQYKEVLGKIGMKPRGGSLTKIPCCDPVGSEHKGSAAWACPGMGLFILDHADKQAVDLDAIVARDLLVCAVALNDASTGFAVGKRRLDVEGSDMIMIFVPRGERFHFATTVERGLKGVTIVVDLKSMRTLGLPIARLPKSLFEIIQRREIVIEALAPGHFGTVAADIIARRGLFPSLARPYYNGKALELFSTLLNQISQRDAMRAEGGAIDPRDAYSVAHGEAVHRARPASDVGRRWSGTHGENEPDKASSHFQASLWHDDLGLSHGAHASTG